MGVKKIKNAYQKPIVTRIELRPQEAVLSACKTGGWPVGGGGPLGSCSYYNGPGGQVVQFNCQGQGS